jgi:hypothetical protein
LTAKIRATSSSAGTLSNYAAGDSTKLWDQNSKKNNFNQAKIDRHLAYIDNKLEEYTSALSEHDGDDTGQIMLRATLKNKTHC